MTEAFCVRCRKKVKMKNEKRVKYRNGNKAKKGTCPNCGITVCKIVKKENTFLSFLLEIFGLEDYLWKPEKKEGEF